MDKIIMNADDLEYALKNSEDIEVDESDEPVAEFIVEVVGKKTKKGKMIKVIEDEKSRV